MRISQGKSRIIWFCVAVFFLSTNLLLADTKLTKKSVESMLDGLTQAVQAKDADKVMTFLAPDAKITVEMGEREFKLSPAKYKDLLDQNWSQCTQYTYEVTDQTVKVAPDGQSAKVTDTTHEKVVINGQKILQDTQEKVEIGLRDGKPVITSLWARPKTSL